MTASLFTSPKPRNTSSSRLGFYVNDLQYRNGPTVPAPPAKCGYRPGCCQSWDNREGRPVMIAFPCRPVVPAARTGDLLALSLPSPNPGAPSGETYVVCFRVRQAVSYYDWEKDCTWAGPVEARRGKKACCLWILPKPKQQKAEYALVGSAIPLGRLVGKGTSRESRARPRPEKKDPGPGRRA